MGLGDGAGDEEAEPGARSRVPACHPAELLEDQALVLGRDPGPVVADVDAHAPVLRVGAHLDLAARRGVLDRVVDQVRQHLAKPFRVAADARQRLLHLGPEANLV